LSGKPGDFPKSGKSGRSVAKLQRFHQTFSSSELTRIFLGLMVVDVFGPGKVRAMRTAPVKSS
jgi:hypothetical protein